MENIDIETKKREITLNMSATLNIIMKIKHSDRLNILFEPV